MKLQNFPYHINPSISSSSASAVYRGKPPPLHHLLLLSSLFFLSSLLNFICSKALFQWHILLTLPFLGPPSFLSMLCYSPKHYSSSIATHLPHIISKHGGPQLRCWCLLILVFIVVESWWQRQRRFCKEDVRQAGDCC